MSIKINYESDLMAKILYQTFSEGSNISNPEVLDEWKKTWMEALKVWHSPYKTLIDMSHLSFGEDPEIPKAIARLFKLFAGFFLKKAVGFSPKAEQIRAFLPFDVYPSEEEAREKLGIRDLSLKKNSSNEDFRSLIHIENHYKQHCIEISFAQMSVIDSKEKLLIFKSKLMNNLMTWHSAWNLLIDCRLFSISEDLLPEFRRLLVFLEGFFLKQVLGYAPSAPKETYPFPVFRSRHLAAAKLEAEGLFSGEEAQCKSRSKETKKP